MFEIATLGYVAIAATAAAIGYGARAKSSVTGAPAQRKESSTTVVADEESKGE